VSASSKSTLSRWNALREKSLDGIRPSTKTPEQRFASKLLRRGSCLVFTGSSRSPDGYGVYSLSGHMFVAHRLAYVLNFGDLDNGTLIKQTCGEHLCCEPSHLRPQLRQELTARRWAKRNAERFWKQVDRSGGTEACWPWTAASERKRFSISGRDETRMSARRAAWIFVRGEVPERYRVYGTCENDSCVNPAHARIASRHAVRPFSVRRPRKPPRHLTDAERTELRELFANGATNRQLCDRFGVRACTVSLYTRGVVRAEGLSKSRHKPLPAPAQMPHELTEIEIEAIIIRRAGGEDLRSLASEFGVRPVEIFRVTNGLVKIAAGRR
jgi:hypothetical protein